MTRATPGLRNVLDAFARGDLAAAAAGFTEDAWYREARKPDIRGRAGIAAHFASFTAAGAAWSFHLDDVLVDTDRACVVYRFAVPGGDGAARLERAGCALVRLDAHGHIAEWREYEG